MSSGIMKRLVFTQHSIPLRGRKYMPTLIELLKSIVSQEYHPTDEEFIAQVNVAVSTELAKNNPELKVTISESSVYERILYTIIINGRFDLYKKLDNIISQRQIPLPKNLLNYIITLSRIGIARKLKNHPQYLYQDIIENYLSILTAFLQEHYKNKTVSIKYKKLATKIMDFPPIDEQDNDALGKLLPIEEILRILLSHNEQMQSGPVPGFQDPFNFCNDPKDRELALAIALSLEKNTTNHNGAGPAHHFNTDSDSERAPLISNQAQQQTNTILIDENNALPSKWLLLLARHQLKILAMAIMIAATIIACTLKLSAIIMLTVIIPLLILPAILLIGSYAASEITDAVNLSQNEARIEDLNLGTHPLF